MSNFWSGLGFALAVSSIALPLTYCTVRVRPPGPADLQLACIKERGDWNPEAGKCVFGK
jgi:hypothetical protein